jgi:O-antigen ligase
MTRLVRNLLDWLPVSGWPLAHAVIPMVLLAYAAGVTAIPLLQGDEQMAVGLLLAVPALTIGIFVAAKAFFGDRLGGSIVAVACIFIIAANFRTREYVDKSIDWQIALKLVALALLLGLAVIFLLYAFSRLRLGGLFYIWLFFFGWLVISSVYSESVVFALICSISMLVVYLYSVYMAVWLSRIRAIEIMLLVALLMCVGSIVVYYAIPSAGRMQAWIAGTQFGDIGRMKGLTGSANAIGVIAATAMIFVGLYYREFDTFGKHMAWPLILAALACLVLSDNRGSMISIVVAIWFFYVVRSDTIFRLLLSITGGLVAVGLLLSFSDEIFSILSRSGRATEISQMSGRSMIWAVVIELWAERPVFGHGFLSALWILPLDPRLFHVAAHTHNLFLELLFAGGIVLLGIFLYAMACTFLQIYRLRAVNEATLIVFFLVRGLTEAGPFGGMVGYSAFTLGVTMALVISKVIDARELDAMRTLVTLARVAPGLQVSRA